MGWEYQKRTFEKNIQKYKDKRIVIYGTGINSQHMLQAFADLNIIGLMDGNRNDGYFYGKKILNKIEVISLKAEVMVIAAQISAMICIYKRICEFCSAHKIILLDKYGNDINIIFEKMIKQQSNIFFRTKKELLEEIDEHEVISFDIFDTLIMRKTLCPEDIFAIVEEKAKRQGLYFQNFQKIRIDAERELLQEHPEKVSANIYEIYENVARKLGMEEKIKEAICSLELETEKNALIQREEMVSVLEYAAEKGKRVYLISDMYLPKMILIQILDGLGIRGYEDILVSCDVRNTKYKMLYQVYKEKYPSNSYLHIGDNEEADGICAAVFGIDFFLIKKAYDILKISTYMEIVDRINSVNERTMVGLVIAKVFNNPFTVNETWAKPVVKTASEAGYLFFAPIITKWVFWLIKQIEGKAYTDILFAARDGFLIQKLYQMAKKELALKNLPDGIYFDASRDVCCRACIENIQDIRWIMGPPFSGTGRELLIERFTLEEDEIMELQEETFASIYDYVDAHQSQIYKKSMHLRKNYLKYMKKIGLKENGKYAFFDFVSCGTCQYFLGRMVPFQIEGYYCGSYQPVSGEIREIPMEAMYQNPDYEKKETCFFANYLLYESVLTSFEGTLDSISDNGYPVKYSGQADCIRRGYIREMQNAIQDFFMDFLQMYVSEEEISLVVVDKLFEFMSHRYTYEECSEFDAMQLIDDFGKNRLHVSRMK